MFTKFALFSITRLVSVSNMRILFSFIQPSMSMSVNSPRIKLWRANFFLSRNFILFHIFRIISRNVRIKLIEELKTQPENTNLAHQNMQFTC